MQKQYQTTKLDAYIAKLRTHHLHAAMRLLHACIKALKHGAMEVEEVDELADKLRNADLRFLAAAMRLRHVSSLR